MLPDLTTLPITCQKTIPEEYIDIMGHMNVTWYIYLFDQATRTFFRSFGFGEPYVERTGMGSFALEQHIRYLGEVRLGDQVTLRTRALGRSEKTLHFIHFMLRDRDGSLAATSELVGAHADLTLRRIAPFPLEVVQALDRVLAEHARLPWQAPVCGVMGVHKRTG